MVVVSSKSCEEFLLFQIYVVFAGDSKGLFAVEELQGASEEVDVEFQVILICKLFISFKFNCFFPIWSKQFTFS